MKLAAVMPLLVTPFLPFPRTPLGLNRYSSIREGGSQLSIEFAYVFSVGVDAPESALICGHDGPPLAARDSSGRFYIEGCDCDVHAYADDGHYLTSVAQCGEGPGELREVTSLAAGDHLFIGGTPPRILEYSEDLKLANQFRLPRAPEQIDLLSSGDLVINYVGRHATEPDIVSLVHIYDRSGSRQVSTGDLVLDGYRAEFDFIYDPPVAVDADDIIWVGRKVNRYQLLGWTHSGQLVKDLRLHADWFPAYRGIWTPQQPLLYANGMSWSNGLLWVLGQVGTDTGKIQTVLDAIDVERGEVIATAKPDRGFAGWINGSLYRQSTTGDDRRSAIDVFVPHVSR